MRLFRIFFAVVFVALGAALGALNREPVLLDLGFTHVHGSLGVMVLATALAGALCGGLALTLGVVAPLQRRLAGREQEEPAASHPPHDFGV